MTYFSCPYRVYLHCPVDIDSQNSFTPLPSPGNRHDMPMIAMSPENTDSSDCADILTASKGIFDRRNVRWLLETCTPNLYVEKWQLRYPWRVSFEGLRHWTCSHVQG